MKKAGLFLICFFIGWVGYRLYSPIFYVRPDMKPLVFRVDGQSTFLPEIKVNGEKTFISERGIEALTMNAMYLNTIQIGESVKKVRIAAFEENQYIPIELHYSDKTMSFNIYTIPEGMPNYWVTETMPSQISDGYILTSFHAMSLDRPSYIAIIGGEGNLLYYRGTDNPETTTFHLQKFKVGQNTVYANHIQTESSMTGAWILGDNVVMDDKFNIIDKVRILPTDRHPQMAADQHDFVVLGDKHYLLVGYWNEPYKMPDGSERTLVSAVVQEQKDGKVLLDWVSSDYPITFDMCIEKCPTYGHEFIDYAHINTVSVDPKDNNLILSLASPYAIVKINRTSGDIMWILSGEKDEFNVPETFRLTRQHDAYMENGELVVFDNAFSSLSQKEKVNHEPFFKRQTARMLRFKLDEKNKKVVSVSEVPLNVYAPYMGSAQKVKDNLIFFGCGSSNGCAAKAVQADGTEVWKLTVQQPYTTYRAYFVDKLD